MKRGVLVHTLQVFALVAGLAFGLHPAAARGAGFAFQTNDVVAFVGGEDVVEMYRLGYAELLLTRALPAQRLRFRGLGWEGDTVYEQPRELNFPPWPEQLKRVGATVLICQFGAAEALQGSERVGAFVEAYARLLDTLAAQTPRMILLSPTPFEAGSGLLPDLTAHNATLSRQVEQVRGLAERRGLAFVDLFSPPEGSDPKRRTRDGWHLSTAGHWEVAQRIVAQLGHAAAAPRAVVPAADGRLTLPELEPLHRAILAKSQLWFHYWRPENWAFLNGDRTEQPSSRDHRNPKVRWFPAEMEQFKPLIEAREREIAELAQRSLKLQ